MRKSHIHTLKAALLRGRWCIVAIAAMLLSAVGCQIQPPLNLARTNDVVVAFGEVITDLDVIWNTDGTWRETWWYGWDDEDVRLWGEIAYPVPSNYEGRFYFYGETPDADTWLSIDRNTYYDRRIRRRFDFGYHNMLLWSNIDSKDGTQTLIIDERDMANINATTSRSRLSYSMPSRAEVYNNPEIFYSGGLERVYISSNFEDYDYFDPDINAWVKQLNTNLYPLVYMYLVQVVVYNNNGRITGLADRSAIDNLADAVNVRTGHTGNNPVVVTHEMRFKHDLAARSGRHADIFGGKFTTFGLCDMDPWSKSRATAYRGSRTDLENHLSLYMHFNNETDSAYYYRITDQLQRQAHGGVITIEIDADTLKIPSTTGGAAGAAFDPTIVKPDSIWHEFPI